MTSGISIRPARREDFGVLVHFRAEMFRDMGWTDEGRLAELAPLYEAYLCEHHSRGDFLAWIAENEQGEAVASVGLLWERVPPTVRNLTGIQAYVLALYVTPPNRRRGIARALTERAVEHARAQGAAVISLHASHEGRGLYESIGFVEAPEMRLFTDPTSASWMPKKHSAAEDAD